MLLQAGSLAFDVSHHTLEYFLTLRHSMMVQPGFVLNPLQYWNRPAHQPTLGPFSGEWYLDLGAMCAHCYQGVITFLSSWRWQKASDEGRKNTYTLHMCVYMYTHNVCVYICLSIQSLQTMSSSRYFQFQSSATEFSLVFLFPLFVTHLIVFEEPGFYYPQYTYLLNPKNKNKSFRISNLYHYEKETLSLEFSICL